MKIIYDPDGNRARYRVESDSGKTYYVTYCGCGDGDENVNTWECDCPAGKHSRRCKHFDEVMKADQYIDEYICPAPGAVVWDNGPVDCGE